MPGDLTTDLSIFLNQFITGALTVAPSGALTSSAPGLSITQTWNNSGVTFTAAKINVTDTASAAGSLLMDLQVGGSSVFYVKRANSATKGSGWGHEITGDTSVTNLFQLSTSRNCFSVRNYTSASVNSTMSFGWSSTVQSDGGLDVQLWRDAANVLALQNGTNAQAFHHYGRWVSSSDRTYLAIRHATTTLASVSGATVTATSLIPAGAIVLGISTQVTVALGTGNGTTGYQVGDGSDADRWGNVTGTATTTKTKNSDWTAATVPIFTAAQNVVITANGGNFNGTGSIWIDVAYAFGDAN